MILYHFLWDLVYLFNIDIAWYKTDAAYIWQQSICWTFIFVAGFSWSLGKQNLKRGILLLGCGFMISIITAIFIPEARVKYGILTFIGSCILIWCVLDQFMQKINYGIGMLGSFTLFLIARQWRSMVHFSQSITHSIWAKEILAYIGFPQAGFNSTDYFPLLPWVFLFATGYFTYHFALERNKLHQICRSGYVPYINNSMPRLSNR